jgi:hypothetical protein
MPPCACHRPLPSRPDHYASSGFLLPPSPPSGSRASSLGITSHPFAGNKRSSLSYTCSSLSTGSEGQGSVPFNVRKRIIQLHFPYLLRSGTVRRASHKWPIGSWKSFAGSSGLMKNGKRSAFMMVILSNRILLFQSLSRRPWKGLRVPSRTFRSRTESMSLYDGGQNPVVGQNPVTYIDRVYCYIP